MNKKYRYDKTKGCMVDASGNPMIENPEDWKPAAPLILSGFAEFIEPIHGTLITNNYQLREFEKRNNVIQVGSDQGNIIEKGLKKKAEESRYSHLSGWMDPT